MTKLICFDFDGTLCDSWPPFEQAAIRYTEINKLPPLCLETLKTGYGYPNDHDFWEGLSREDQVDHLHKLYRIVDDPRSEMMGGIYPVLFDGVLDTLDNLKAQGYTLALVTARPNEPLQVILDHHDLHKYFCGLRTHDDHEKRGERGKPHPDQLLSVIKELNFAPEDAVMVGDTCMDMKMGAAAGVRTIGVTWGNHCIKRLSEGGAVHVVEEKFTDLQDVIENWRNEFQAA